MHSARFDDKGLRHPGIPGRHEAKFAGLERPCDKIARVPNANRATLWDDTHAGEVMAEADDSRRFDDREFSLILRKAAELQESDANRPARAGLTLREIEAIAAEAGIDVRHVRGAVLALRDGASHPWRRILGPSSHIHAQTSVTSEYNGEALAAIVDAAQAETGRAGSAREVLGGIEWNGRDTMGTVQVTARRRGAETRIQVSTDRKEAAASIATLAPIGCLVAGGAIGSLIGVAPVAAAGVAVVTGVVTARLLWNGVARKWDRRVRRILDRVVIAAETADRADRKRVELAAETVDRAERERARQGAQRAETVDPKRVREPAEEADGVERERVVQAAEIAGTAESDRTDPPSPG